MDGCSEECGWARAAVDGRGNGWMTGSRLATVLAGGPSQASRSKSDRWRVKGCCCFCHEWISVSLLAS